VSDISIKRFKDRLFDLLEEAKQAKKSPFELKRIAEDYLGIFKEMGNYNDLDSTTREILNYYHPEIFKIAEPEQNQTQAYRLPKSSS